MDEEALTELFSIAGNVKNVELKKDDEGKSRGYGFVGKFQLYFKSSLVIMCKTDWL